MNKSYLSLVLLLGAGPACVDGGTDSQPPGPAPSVQPGEPLTARDNGLIYADVFVGDAQGLTTLGVAIVVDGADIVAWERDDSLLKEAGGQVLPLESRVHGGALRLVLGTTAAVSTDEEARIASLVLRPSGEGEVQVRVVSSGDDLGLLDRTGQHVLATTRVANGGES